MASNIVFTLAEGTGTTFTFHGSLDAAVTAGNNFVFTRLIMTSPSPLQTFPTAGHDGIDSKHMGARSDLILIEGYIMDPADSEANIIAAAKILRQKNNQRASWAVQLGGNDIGTDKGMVISDIILEALGEGTGPRFPFRMALIDLGG